MKKTEKRKGSKKNPLFLVIAGIFLIAWAVRVIMLTRKWDAYFPTMDMEWTDTIQQAGLDIRLLEYQLSNLDEIEERFGRAAESHIRDYKEFDPQNGFRFYVVTYELANHTEEEHSYPMHDVLMAGDLWATIPFYPYLFVCNGDDEERAAAHTPQPGEMTRYSVVYAIAPGDVPLYLEFAHDGALVRLNIPEGKEIVDGEVVEA